MDLKLYRIIEYFTKRRAVSSLFYVFMFLYQVISNKFCRLLLRRKIEIVILTLSQKTSGYTYSIMCSVMCQKVVHEN